MRLPPALLALSPGDLDETRAGAFLERLECAREAGLAGLILREPGMGDRALLALAREARAVLARGWLAIHDRAHLAGFCGADAVHLGFDSLSPYAVREWIAAEVALGFSAHAHDEPGARAGADYLLFGPVRETPSKAGRVSATGFDGLAQACAREARPIWGLGGLEPQDAPRVRAAGACGLAVLRGILAADDPARAARAYLDAWERSG